MAYKLSDFKTEVHVDWCPGCGDYGILSSIQMALAGLNVPPQRTAIFSGIGCSGKTTHYVKAYGVHTLHGRVLPYATGAKLANPNLLVIAVGGDGDGLGIGAGHFIGAGRRNLDITYVLFNNGVYGLTKGQASPTLKLGMQTKGLSQPNPNEGVNPLMLALAAGYTFMARGYAFNVPELVKLIRQGVEHHGSSFIEVLQPCPTYNNLNTRDWYGGLDRPDPETGRAQPRVYSLADTGYDPLLTPEMSEEQTHELLGRYVARTSEWGERIPVGVFLINRTTSTYEERISRRIPFYTQQTPAERVIADEAGRPTVDLSPLLAELRVS